MTMNEQVAIDEHQRCNALLPWYANGTLDPAEHRAVREHIESCDTCRSDVRVFEKMRSAVTADAPSPISSKLTAADVISRANEPQRRTAQSAWRIAATIAVAVPALWLLSSLVIEERPGERFEAVTSDSQAAAVQYVVEVTFEPDVSAERRSAVLQSIGQPISAGAAGESQRVVVELPPRSLDELSAYAEQIAEQAEIAAAEFVAVQVPVR